MGKVSPMAEWFRISFSVPTGIYYAFKIQCARDRVSATQILLTLCAAYSKGEIRLAPDDRTDTRRQPRIGNTGYIDDYRIKLYDTAGRLLNPLPLTDEDL